MKRCSTCRRHLPEASFAKKRASADGLQATCRSCNSAWAAANRPRTMALPPQVGEGEKWCRDCDTVKSLNDFARHRKMPDGRQTYCRECFARRYRAGRAARGKLTRPLDIPEGHKFCRSCQTTKPRSDFGLRRSPNGDGRMSACKECRSVQSRADYLKRTYGFTDENVTELLRQQGGLCAICRSAPAVHVDHDHKTGRVRGMCCFSCNAALGHFRDDPVILRRAARYLEGRRPRRTAHKRGMRFEILLPADELAPRAGEGVFEGWLRAMVAISGSRVEQIRFDATTATVKPATEGTP